MFCVLQFCCFCCFCFLFVQLFFDFVRLAVCLFGSPSFGGLSLSFSRSLCFFSLFLSLPLLSLPLKQQQQQQQQFKQNTRLHLREIQFVGDRRGVIDQTHLTTRNIFVGTREQREAYRNALRARGKHEVLVVLFLFLCSCVLCFVFCFWFWFFVCLFFLCVCFFCLFMR